jgi:hypothetical protein
LEILQTTALIYAKHADILKAEHFLQAQAMRWL